MMEHINHQRKGARSNAAVGADFERLAQAYWQGKGISLQQNFPLVVGVSHLKKQRKFDLGDEKQKTIVECKSHKWTESDKVPSAKLTVWNESMYYFAICPVGYRRLFFCLRDFSLKRQCTLAEYYVAKYAHLIPDDVEIWEYDDTAATARVVTQP